MIINFPIEEGYFNISPVKFCDLDSYLITPERDAKWNKNNLHFRSLIVDKGGKVLSSGFPKFFNYGEKPECYPNPEKYEDWRILNKLDGSLLIADLVNGVFSMRTRGTGTYKNQKNYKDFELLPLKYPKIPEYLKYNQKYSLLFEILTPNNVIVIRPKEVEFYLLGAVDKETLKMVSGEELLTIWKQTGCVPFPEQYDFGCLGDLDSLNRAIKHWRGKEGVVLVYNNGQNRIKLKSDWYNQLHRIKSELNSINNLVEFYVNNDMPSYDEFYAKLDFEIAEQLKDEIYKICKAGDHAKEKITSIKEFVDSILRLDDRKKQAEQIIKKYAKENLASYAFSILSGKTIEKKQIEKLIFYHIEKNER
jgi:hypothetical protein